MATPNFSIASFHDDDEDTSDDGDDSADLDGSDDDDNELKQVSRPDRQLPIRRAFVSKLIVEWIDVGTLCLVVGATNGYNITVE